MFTQDWLLLIHRISNTTIDQLFLLTYDVSSPGHLLGRDVLPGPFEIGYSRGLSAYELLRHKSDMCHFLTVVSSCKTP